MATQPRIAIVGAGPGGLCVANILQLNNISFVLFEGDASPHERNQGGTLDLHPQFGQLAMKEAGLWDEFCKHSRPEADVMKIIQTDGHVVWDGNGPDKHETPEELRRPEIDREKLNQILLQNLNPQNLKFGHHLQEVVLDSSNPGKHDLIFREDTPTEKGFDLVIGADGAWSKVRKLLTPTLPHYSGISALELWKSNVESTSPWLSNFIGAGSCFCLAADRAILMQRLGDGSVRTYACLRAPESFFKDLALDFHEPESTKTFIETYYGDVHPDLRRALLDTNSNTIPRTLYHLPIDFKWPHQQGLTLLGDAAHLMTPFAGVGVNAALADSLDLAKAIVASRGDLDRAVIEYETRLFPRAEQFARRTAKGLSGHFSADGALELARRHREAFARV